MKNSYLFKREDLSATENYLHDFEEFVKECHARGVTARREGSPEKLNEVFGMCVDATMSMPADYVSRLYHKYESLTELCEFERKRRTSEYIAAVRAKDEDAHATQHDAESAAFQETSEGRLYAARVKYLANWARVLVERVKSVQIQVSHFRTNQ